MTWGAIVWPRCTAGCIDQVRWEEASPGGDLSRSSQPAPGQDDGKFYWNSPRISGHTTTLVCADGCFVWFCFVFLSQLKKKSSPRLRVQGVHGLGGSQARRWAPAGWGTAGPVHSSAGRAAGPSWQALNAKSDCALSLSLNKDGGAAANDVAWTLKGGHHRDGRQLPENPAAEMPPERTGKWHWQVRARRPIREKTECARDQYREGCKSVVLRGLNKWY